MGHGEPVSPSLARPRPVRSPGVRRIAAQLPAPPHRHEERPPVSDLVRAAAAVAMAPAVAAVGSGRSGHRNCRDDRHSTSPRSRWSSRHRCGGGDGGRSGIPGARSRSIQWSRSTLSSRSRPWNRSIRSRRSTRRCCWSRSIRRAGRSCRSRPGRRSRPGPYSRPNRHGRCGPRNRRDCIRRSRRVRCRMPSRRGPRRRQVQGPQRHSLEQTATSLCTPSCVFPVWSGNARDCFIGRAPKKHNPQIRQSWMPDCQPIARKPLRGPEQ
jgi:hypothetical protein